MEFGQRKNPARQLVQFGLVILFHVGIIYALATGLGRNVIDVLKQPIETKIIEEVKPPPPDVPPPPPPPKLAAPPPPYIPPPEIQLQTPPPTPNAIQSPTTSTKPTEVAPPVARPVEAPPVPDSSVSARPIGGPPLVYPSRMLDSGREGSVDVECTVDTDGSTSDCVLIEVKGGSAFGDAAMKFVTAARYKPAIKNGKAIREEHHRFHIAFTLKN